MHWNLILFIIPNKCLEYLPIYSVVIFLTATVRSVQGLNHESRFNKHTVHYRNREKYISYFPLLKRDKFINIKLFSSDPTIVYPLRKRVARK